MKLYKIMYSPAVNKFFYAVTSSDSNISDYVGKDFTEFTASGVCEDENRKLSEGYQIMMRCNKCKRYFILTNDQLLWIKRKGFEDSIPKKCKRCKAKIKKP